MPYENIEKSVHSKIIDIAKIEKKPTKELIDSILFQYSDIYEILKPLCTFYNENMESMLKEAVYMFCAHIGIKVHEGKMIRTLDMIKEDPDKKAQAENLEQMKERKKELFDMVFKKLSNKFKEVGIE